MKASKYITTADAAKIIGVCDRQVQRYCEQGKLGKKPGRNWIITDADIKKFLGDVTHWGHVFVPAGKSLYIYDGQVYRRVTVCGGDVVIREGGHIQELIIGSGSCKFPSPDITITE